MACPIPYGDHKQPGFKPTGPISPTPAHAERSVHTIRVHGPLTRTVITGDQKIPVYTSEHGMWPVNKGLQNDIRVVNTARQHR